MSDFIKDPDHPGFYIGIFHPKLGRALRQEAARMAWYHQHHVARWERRYHQRYPEPTMEVGKWQGMKVIIE